MCFGNFVSSAVVPLITLSNIRPWCWILSLLYFSIEEKVNRAKRNTGSFYILLYTYTFTVLFNTGSLFVGGYCIGMVTGENCLWTIRHIQILVFESKRKTAEIKCQSFKIWSWFSYLSIKKNSTWTSCNTCWWFLMRRITCLCWEWYQTIAQDLWNWFSKYESLLISQLNPEEGDSSIVISQRIM